MRPNKQYLLTAIERCRRAFGSDAIRVVPSEREHQRALQFPSGVPSDWSASQAMWDVAAQVASVGMPLSRTPLVVWHDTDMTLEAWAQVIAAVEAPLPPAPVVPSSPSYGAAGKPSIGRLVQYQLGMDVVVGIIERVYDVNTGDVCLLHFGLPPSADGWHADGGAGRASSTIGSRVRASFGSSFGQWQYLPRV